MYKEDSVDKTRELKYWTGSDTEPTPDIEVIINSQLLTIRFNETRYEFVKAHTKHERKVLADILRELIGALERDDDIYRPY